MASNYFKNGFYFSLIVGIFTTLLLAHKPAEKETTDPIQHEAQASEQQVEEGLYLDIPTISLHEKLQTITPQGRTIPVPDMGAGLLKTGDNSFIVGHNTGVFSRLSEIPQTISLIQDGAPTYYNLDFYLVQPNSEVDMTQATTYHGIVIMTCAGGYQNGWTHKLSLYYK